MFNARGRGQSAQRGLRGGGRGGYNGAPVGGGGNGGGRRVYVGNLSWECQWQVRNEEGVGGGGLLLWDSLWQDRESRRGRRDPSSRGMSGWG